MPPPPAACPLGARRAPHFEAERDAGFHHAAGTTVTAPAPKRVRRDRAPGVTVTNVSVTRLCQRPLSACADAASRRVALTRMHIMFPLSSILHPVRAALGLAALGLAALAPVPVAAQRVAPPGALAVTAERVAAASDSVTRPRTSRAATTLLSGDEVRYRLRFTNTTEGPVRNVRFANPVPKGLVMVGASATADRDDAQVEYSIDGGRSYAAQPMVEVEEEGRRVRRPAPSSMITDLRWTVAGAVAPGETVAVAYRATWPGARVASREGNR